MSSKNIFNDFNFDKLFGSKKFFYIIILICAAVVLYCFTFDSKGKDLSKETAAGSSLASYKNELTCELCDILQKIDGVGKVEVMITFQTDTKQQVVYNIKETSSKNNQNSTNNTISKDAVMMKNGTVNMPYTIKNDIPDIKGVLIVAQGAENKYIEQKIKDAVVTVLKIPAYRAVVLPMGK